MFVKCLNGKSQIITLIGAILIIGVYSCKKQESEKEDVSLTMSVEQIMQEPSKEKSLLKDPVSLEEKLYKQTKIAFSSNRDGNWEIYVMNSDGSGQKKVTNHPATDDYPCWSPDGKKMVFRSNRDGNWKNHAESDQIYEIYVMNADGSEVKRLTNDRNMNYEPSWSPDGKKIACTSLYGVINVDIYVMNADGSEQRRLTNSPGSYSPKWSFDGKKIAFESSRDGSMINGNFEIYVMNADGIEQRNITFNPAWDGSPSWSPDGKKIVFRSNRDGNVGFYVMNADGSEVKRITSNPIMEADPSWAVMEGDPSWSPFLVSEKETMEDEKWNPK